MVWGLPGHRIAPKGRPRAAVGATILCAAGCNPAAGKMVGPRTSLRRKGPGHHAQKAVSQDPAHLASGNSAPRIEGSRDRQRTTTNCSAHELNFERTAVVADQRQSAARHDRPFGLLHHFEPDRSRQKRSCRRGQDLSEVDRPVVQSIGGASRLSPPLARERKSTLSARTSQPYRLMPSWSSHWV